MMTKVWTGVHLNDYGCTLKAYRRETLADVRLYGEMHRFMPAYASWTGAAISPSPDPHWSNPANWQANVAPVAGDDLVFPPGAQQLTILDSRIH